MYKKQGSPHDINSMLEGLISTFKRRSSRNYPADTAFTSLSIGPKLSNRGLMKLNVDIRPLHLGAASISSNALEKQAVQQQPIQPNVN
jgi:hypothetical protein